MHSLVARALGTSRDTESKILPGAWLTAESGAQTSPLFKAPLKGGINPSPATCTVPQPHKRNESLGHLPKAAKGEKAGEERLSHEAKHP